MKKFVGFGDFLLRLNPEGYLRFIQADRFMIHFTGAEANVCVSLAAMGAEAEFVTRVPDNDIARCGLAQMSKFGVSTRHIAWGGERLGVFYCEKGASQRPSKIVYDRKFSSFATAEPSDFNWDAIFEGAEGFHITGITPALSDTMPAICLAACKKAKERGVTVSCDLNYRKNLWTTEKAKPCMEKLLQYVDLLIANEEDCDKVLGIRATDSDVEKGQLSPAGYADMARQLCERFPFKGVGITLRASVSASENDWSALYYTRSQAFFSRRYRVHIVDRVGSGDSFAAGLLYALALSKGPQEAVEFAAAASCLKHSIEMDFNLSTAAEIEKLALGEASGRVQR